MGSYSTSDASHTFNAEIRVDDIKNNAGTGLPNLNGTSPEIKWQRKDLTVDIATSGTVTQLGYASGLTIGKTYRFSVHAMINTASTTMRSDLAIAHDGADLAKDFGETDADGERISHSMMVIFTATATSVSVEWTEGTGNGTLEGTAANSCFSFLEELPYHTETTF